MILLIIALVLAPMLMALVGTALAKRLALRLGMLDAPGERKVHVRTTPRNGGIAIFWAIAIPVGLGLLMMPWIQSHRFFGLLPKHAVTLMRLEHVSLPLTWLLLACTLAMHLLGLLDDRLALGALPKLIGQLAIATALVVIGEKLKPGGFRILTVLDGKITGGYFISCALTVAWLTVLTNAFNFLDNMDGLAAGVAVICSLMFVIAAAHNAQWLVCAILLVYIGAILGFLWHNFPPASIFMGDGGSMVLGFLLAALTIRTTYFSPPEPWYGIFTPLLICAVPLYDFCTVIAIRMRRGRNPMKGDTNHFSHRLTRHGFSNKAAVLIIYAITLATGLSAPLLVRADAVGAALIALQAGSLLLVIHLLERVGEHIQ